MEAHQALPADRLSDVLNLASILSSRKKDVARPCWFDAVDVCPYLGTVLV
jgi:hypothetical protein